MHLKTTSKNTILFCSNLPIDRIIMTTCFRFLAVIVVIHSLSQAGLMFSGSAYTAAPSVNVKTHSLLPIYDIMPPYYSQEIKYMCLNNNMKVQGLKSKENGLMVYWGLLAVVTKIAWAVRPSWPADQPSKPWDLFTN